MSRRGRACVSVLSVTALLAAGGCGADVPELRLFEDPCAEGAPATEQLDEPPFAGDPPESVAQELRELDVLRQQLEGLAGDRLAGAWRTWQPELGLVLSLTEGPVVPAMHQYADASSVPVEVRYTASVSEAELEAALADVPSTVWEARRTRSGEVDVVNNRIAFEVAAGDDDGAEHCRRLQDALVDLGVPYGFEVVEATLRSGTS